MSSLTDPVLVTGATGFIGRHLARALVGQGLRVHGLSRAMRAGPSIDGVHWWQADLGDRAAVQAVVAEVRPGTVFHFAGHTAGRGRADADAIAESFAVNLHGTLSLLEVLADAKRPPARIVCAGGLEEYGNGPVPFVESQREAPVSAYSASQVAATHTAQMLHATRGLPVVVLRLGLVYGPEQSTTFLIPALFEACWRGRPFPMTDGLQTRDYVYVGDVVDAARRAAVAEGVEGQVINVSEGVERRVAEVARQVAAVAGRSDCLQVGALPARSLDVRRMVCDPSRARTLLQWRATTSFEAGLRATAQWQRERRVATQAR